MKKTKTHIISVSNQKGGVGKTTTAINLGTSLAATGKEVLLIDLDPQGNASTGLGIPVEQRRYTTYEVVLGAKKIEEIIKNTKVPNLKIAPSNTKLSSADIDLTGDKKRVLKLKESLQESFTQNFDYVLIDCPPALNILTVNAFAASSSVLVPLQAEFFALEGLSQLILTIQEVRKNLNKRLKIHGIILTMYDKRNKHAQSVEDDVRENLGDLVFETVIPRNVRLSEASSYALPAVIYDQKCSGALAYQKLAAEILKRQEKIGF